MNLVGYSDSEGSDSEPTRPPTKLVAKPAAKAAQTLVNPGTNKVKVNLASLTSARHEEAEHDARPAKRQRTGGGLNIDAFLPPPKQPTKTLANEGSSFAAKKAAGKGLGRGVNLKTGAEPAFTRSEASASLDIDGEPKDIKEVIAELRRSRVPAGGDARSPVQSANDASTDAVKEVKLVGNAMRFKPKSVARGPVKKKVGITATTAPAPLPPATKALSAATTEASRSRPIPSQAAPAKAKVSLFSFGGAGEDSVRAAANPDEADLDGDTDMAEVPDDAFGHDEQAQLSRVPGQNSVPATSSSAMEGLNLSAAEMRQLFGRKAGKGGQTPDLGSIKVVNFNADDQYAANEEWRAKGEIVQHNPVRGIAPGKHSLKQLVNAAATQADALEEHFAQGKRNQKEAGSRYGW
jgi:hypothetical protein